MGDITQPPVKIECHIFILKFLGAKNKIKKYDITQPPAKIEYHIFILNFLGAKIK